MGDSSFSYIGHETYRLRCATELSRLIGKGRPWSDEAVAEKVGREPRTIQAHRLGETAPDGVTLLNYFALFGRYFSEPVLNLIGMTGAVRIERVHQTPHEVVAKQAAALASFTRALQDGALSAGEKFELRPVVRKLAADMAAFADALDRQIEAEIGRKDL